MLGLQKYFAHIDRSQPVATLISGMSLGMISAGVIVSGKIFAPIGCSLN